MAFGSTPPPKDKDGKLNLLLCDADDCEPAFDKTQSGQAAKKQGKADKVNPFGLWGEDKTQDLRVQRWGVIAPEGPDGDRLLELIAPLIKLRAAQQGAPVKTYRVRPDYDYVQADEWRRNLFAPGGQMGREVPRYQLILGNLDQVGMATQLTQASDGFVGRLAFSDEQGYVEYVNKVIKAEAQRDRVKVGLGAAKFFSVHDGTASTMDAFEKLMDPGFALAKEQNPSGEFPARSLESLGDRTDPDPQEFLNAVKTTDPTVMLSMSHGAGTPKKMWKSLADKLGRQGAMSFGKSAGLLTAADIGDRPFLPGGVWFMFACFGAGTPMRSAYAHWLEKLRDAGQFPGSIEEVLRSLPKEGEKPFIAALPQLVLRKENGPLAFIGHIDLAWNYSYDELDSKTHYARPGRYIDVLRSLLEGNRVGLAFRELMRFFGQVNTALTSRIDQTVAGKVVAPSPEEEATRGHLWMLRQDLAGYMLLGDPAVRMAIDPSLVEKPKAPEPPPGDIFSVLGIPGLGGPSPSASPGAPASALSTDKLEKAIAQLLCEAKTAEQIAQDTPIDIDELRRLAKQYSAAGRQGIDRS